MTINTIESMEAKIAQYSAVIEVYQTGLMDIVKMFREPTSLNDANAMLTSMNYNLGMVMGTADRILDVCKEDIVRLFKARNRG